MNLLCISGSNINLSSNSTSYKICEFIIEEVKKTKEVMCSSIIELKKKFLMPCCGCGRCYLTKRCVHKDDFNEIYEQIIQSDLVFIVSPHYAPIPAKLAMVLEKMEQITFLHWVKDNNYKSEVFGIQTGVISHGGGSGRVLRSYKHMVNDTIANALDTIQMKIIPYSEEWNTGISLPVNKVTISNSSIFPKQEYNWSDIRNKIKDYIAKI